MLCCTTLLLEIILVVVIAVLVTVVVVATLRYQTVKPIVVVTNTLVKSRVNQGKIWQANSKCSIHEPINVPSDFIFVECEIPYLSHFHDILPNWKTVMDSICEEACLSPNGHQPGSPQMPLSKLHERSAGPLTGHGTFSFQLPDQISLFVFQ